MLDAVFLFGVACACVGVCYGRRAAFALLVSAAIGLALNEAGVPFIFPLWMMIDLVVVLAILWPKFHERDLPILALFVPLWVLYLVPSQAGYVGSVLISAAQMALTFPAKRAWDDVRRLAGRRPPDGGMLMVAHNA